MLACVEGALQLFYRVTAGDFLFARATSPVWAANPYSGVFNRPNLALHQGTNEFEATYYTDAEGLRVARAGASVAREKPGDTLRVMLLGPSFAFGWGVDYEQSFAARLEEQLPQARFAGGRRIEVVNAGVNSMPPAPHLEWYRHVGSGYRPDLVIQFIYGSLRVPNQKQVDARVDAEGYLVRRDLGPLQQLRRYAKNSATVFYAWVVAARLGATLDAGNAPEVQGAGRELHAAQSGFDPRAPEEVEALAFYHDLDATVRRSGGELLIVYFPLSYAVHPEDTSRWRHLGVRDVASQMRFDAAFCEHLSGQGIPCLDVTPALRRAAGSGERLYYWLDIHWTPGGNAVVARAVAEHLLGPDRSDATAGPGADRGQGSTTAPGGTPSRQRAAAEPSQ